MLFSSPIFLFYFLPVVLALYFIAPAKLKNLILAVCSIFFYTWGEKILVLVMLTATVVDYFAAILIDNGKRRLGIILSVVMNLSFLGFFKYFNFAFENFYGVIRYLGWDPQAFHHVPHIVLPIGISFYTFQTLSYTIDVYRSHVKATRNFIDFVAYVTIFPQLIAGPIVRYVDIEHQLRNKAISVSNFALGVERFVIGFAKKMLIANSCAEVADSIFATPVPELSTGWSWIGIAMYSFQIYFDFSGYSDMAIGLGKMLGFHFLENFNYPYISKNIREFWRRWHISLSTWFRDYVYIPLGGNQGKTSRVYLNLLIVFFVTGLWHGASWNFIIWGLFHGFFIVIERAGFDRILNLAWKPVQHLYTLMIVMVGWVFFRAEDLPHALSYLGKMFNISNGEPSRLSYLTYFYNNPQYILTGLIATVLSASSYAFLSRWKVSTRVPYVLAEGTRTLIGLILFIISLSFVAADTYNPFIYFRF